MLIESFAGLVGYPGLNERGVSVFQNALSTNEWRGGAMPHYFLKRVLLEQSTVGDCENVARASQCCSSANYVVTDGHGVLCDFEITPSGMAVLDGLSDILVHTNHFRDETLKHSEALLPRIPDSAIRASRMESLLQARHGRIALDDVKSAFADHKGFPTSICRHDTPS
jgi:isopenicillin-N N-acyltransferase-like protein